METKGYVKPRFDGGGTEFGAIHRKLGPGYLMFDIDRVFASMEYSLTMRKENEGFVEYRRSGNKIKFIALMEYKAQKTEHSVEALDKNEANSLARLEMARLLKCRLIVIFGTNGREPFEFFEIDTTTGDNRFVGILEYDQFNKEQQVKDFWTNVLKIPKY